MFRDSAVYKGYDIYNRLDVAVWKLFVYRSDCYAFRNVDDAPLLF